MKLNLAPAIALLGSLGVASSSAGTIVSETINLIDMAEQIYEGLKGSDKFAAVQAGLKTVVADLGLTADFDKIWHALAPFVSVVVTVWNLANLWPHQQPATTAPKPDPQ